METHDKAKALFLSHVRSTNDPDGCHLWTGALNNRGGYGVFEFEGRTQTAHRVSYNLFNGPIPDGLHVRHTCDNPPCVRPDHLILGTREENEADMYDRLQMALPDYPLTAAEREVLLTWTECGKTLDEIGHGMALHPGTLTRGLKLARKEREWALAVFTLASAMMMQGREGARYAD